MSTPAPACLLRVSEESGRVTARFPAVTNLTEENAEVVARELAALVEGRDRPHLTLDLGRVAYLTSVALGKLIALNGKVRARGGRFDLANPTPDVRKVFAVTRLDRVLNIVTPADALSA